MIYFLSDAHIGSRAMGDGGEHQQRFIALIERLSEDATAFYLLGDIFDYWYEYLWRDRSKEEYRPLLNCLRAITDRGIEVHYFTGNHDIWVFGWLEKQTGVILHRREEVLTISGKRCMLAHGDGLIPANYLSQFPKDIQKKIGRFMRLRALFHNPVAQQLFRLMPPALGNKIGYGWAKSSREKEMANPCPYKGENREELVLYAKEHEKQEHIDYYIFGHRHIELDLLLASDARVLILGDCFRQWTYAKMTEEGEVTIDN